MTYFWSSFIGIGTENSFFTKYMYNCYWQFFWKLLLTLSLLSVSLWVNNSPAVHPSLKWCACLFLSVCVYCHVSVCLSVCLCLVLSLLCVLLSVYLRQPISLSLYLVLLTPSTSSSLPVWPLHQQTMRSMASSRSLQGQSITHSFIQFVSIIHWLHSVSKSDKSRSI